MEALNMFEQASRSKLRFKAQNGLIATEDLWDLPLTHLDVIAKGLRKELRETEDSFIDEKKGNNKLELRFEIVKYVITTKIAERDALKLKAEKAAKRQRILAVMEGVQNEVDKGKSIAELQKELDSLAD